MPVIRFKSKIAYFSHIPKCGGTSVENFLKLIAGLEISFLDRNFYDGEVLPWSISSPQHITGHHVRKLFPISFFDEFFTVSRHPFDRFSSAFVFQKYFAKRINENMSIDQFACNLEGYGALTSGRYDHHFLPQVDFLYPGASYKAFKLENGLEGPKKYVGTLLGIEVSGIAMPHSLKQPNHVKLMSGSLSDHSKNVLRDIYKMDFEKFGY